MGEFPMHHVVPRLLGTPGSIRTPAPRLGEHNREVLASGVTSLGSCSRRSCCEKGIVGANEGTNLPVWRSLLYVPVNVEKYVDKAHTRGADVIQLDLEDSVPPAEKERRARWSRRTAARVRRGGADVVVRINQPLSLAVRDLEHSDLPGRRRHRDHQGRQRRRTCGCSTSS